MSLEKKINNKEPEQCKYVILQPKEDTHRPIRDYCIQAMSDKDFKCEYLSHRICQKYHKE